MAKLSHPFLRHPEPIEVDNDRAKEVDELFEWIKVQPRFPPFTRNHAHLFLHSCYYDMAATKFTVQKYVEVRAHAPELFDNRDPTLPSMQKVFDLCEMIWMPKRTPEGYELLIYRLVDTDPSKVIFSECIKAFSMFNDIRLSDDLLADGYVVIFDMKGVRLSHVTRVQLGPLRSFMTYIQEAHPARLKKIYIVHAASFVNQVMAMVKPLIKSEMMSLLHFTTEGPSTLFPKELLPIEYDGTLGSIPEYYKEQRKYIETEYKEWLIESAQFKKTPKDKSKSKSKNRSKNDNDVKASISPPIHSFSALEID